MAKRKGLIGCLVASATIFNMFGRWLVITDDFIPTMVDSSQSCRHSSSSCEASDLDDMQGQIVPKRSV